MVGLHRTAMADDTDTEAETEAETKARIDRTVEQ